MYEEKHGHEEKQACALGCKCGGNGVMMTRMLIVAVLAVGGYFLIADRKKDDKMSDAGNMKQTPVMQSEGSPNEPKPAAMTESNQMMSSAGSYEAYDASKLAKAKEGKVVLFFRASWCPSCKALDADIRSHMNDIPKNVTILDVDYDSNTDLKQKYGITMQHTMVEVDTDGKQLKKWVASPTLADIVAHL